MTSLIIDFERVRNARVAERNTTFLGARIRAVKLLAPGAQYLRGALEKAFGLPVELGYDHERLNEVFTASFCDRIGIHQRVGDFEGRAVGYGTNHDHAIAALYHQMTAELHPGRTIRKWDENGQFVTYGFNRELGTFYRRMPEGVVASIGPAGPVGPA